VKSIEPCLNRNLFISLEQTFPEYPNNGAGTWLARRLHASSTVQPAALLFGVDQELFWP
jgi:hypothetical protein